MEPAKQKLAAFQRTLELLVNQWKDLDRLGAEEDQNPKGLESVVKVENQDSFDSKMSELNDKKNEVLLKLRELELTERINQKEFEEKEKILEQRSLELDSQERDLPKTEMKLDLELEEIKKREADLHLGKKRLENLKECFEIKNMMFDMKMEVVAGGSSSRSKQPRQEPVSKSAVEIEGIQRKRRRDASGCARNVPISVEVDLRGFGLSFSRIIVNSHTRAYMTLPGSFVSAYDLSLKKYVILSTDKGNFCLEVRHYSSPQRSVQLWKGWKDFYSKNLLEVGCECLFRLKEDTVNGDASGFAMDVCVLGR